MKTAIASLCLLGLTFVNAQDAATPAKSDVYATTTMRIGGMSVGAAPARQLPGGVVELRSLVVAKDVEITMSTGVLTADEAEIRYGVAGQNDELELRGNVRMKAKIKVQYR